MLCAFLGLPSFSSSCDDILWHSVYITGRWDLLKASNVSDLSERAARCTRIGEENSIEVAHISITFVGMIFFLVCSPSSYSIELVTELSCLLVYISDFFLYHCFTTAHSSHVCFLPLSVSSGDQAFCTSKCRHVLVLEIIGPLLASQTIPVLTCVPPAPPVFASAGCLRVS